MFLLAILSVLQDFESERKWKLTQAKKVALKASKGMVDQATRGEKKMKVLISFHLIKTIVYNKQDMVTVCMFFLLPPLYCCVMRTASCTGRRAALKKSCTKYF